MWWSLFLWGDMVLAAEYVSASGGDAVYDINVGDIPYRVHVFTNIGTASFTVLEGGPVELMIVAGGGGGGVDRDSGGGGGAGGVVFTNLSVSPAVHEVTVGSGGSGFVGSGSAAGTGVNGNDSAVFGVVAAGGGGGGYRIGALEGGSGGGGGAGGRTLLAIPGAEGMPAQGHRGGAAFDALSGYGRSGGGGGAGAVGDDYDAGGGAGGTGVVSAITGTHTHYGGGGGGGAEVYAGDPGPGGQGGGGAGGKATGNENGSGPGHDGLGGTGGGGGGAGTRGTGTRGGNGGSGIVVIRYVLDSVSFLMAQPFGLANIETGSTRFTNTNEVDVFGLRVPIGCTHVQITESGDPAAVDAGGWISTNQPPPMASFALPAADTNVTLYAWFTNTAETVWLHRAEGGIVYTTVSPEPLAADKLTRGIIPGESVAVLSIMDIDLGSTGGMHDETELDLIGGSLFCKADVTPGLPEVTLNALGSYDVILTVTNEAGNTAMATSTVSVVSPGTYTYYVDINNLGNDEAPYMSWATAATNIQDAVNQAEADLHIDSGVYCEVVVADGTYPLTATLVLADAITVRSVNGRAATVIDGQYPAYSNRCVLITGDAILDGFTVSNGYALATGDDLSEPDPLAHRRGGGIYVVGAAAKILNCDIVQNRAAQTTGTWGQGGGIALVAANGTVVSNCLVAGNSTMSEGYGTGLLIAGSAALVVQCVISNNLQTGNSGNGGGFWMDSGTISNSFIVDNYGARYGANRMSGGSIVGCVFSNNWGRSTGGAIDVWGGVLADSILVNNRSGAEGGGGLHLRGGTATDLLIIGNTTMGSGGGVRQNRGTLRDSVIIGNYAGGSGGGLYTADHTVRNCLFAGNDAAGAGGGVYRHTVNTGHTLQSCSIVRNRAGTSGGGIYVPGTYANVYRNVVVAHNQAGGMDNDAEGDVAGWAGNFLNSRAAELIDGVNGNITADPRFRQPGLGYGTNAVLGVYVLWGSSPCVDTGVNQVWMTGALDLAGNPRVVAARPWLDKTPVVDMGAYETPPVERGTVVLLR